MARVRKMSDEDERILSVWDIVREMQKVLNEHVKLSWNQYREIRELYGSPSKFWKDALQEFFPQNSEKFFELFSRWFDEQMGTFERNMGNAISETVRGYPSEDYPVPPVKDYQKFVNEHINMWIKNYKKLSESREQYDKATLEFLKSIFPENMHPMLEDAARWKRDQTVKTETEVFYRLEKQRAMKAETVKPIPVRIKKKGRKR